MLSLKLKQVVVCACALLCVVLAADITAHAQTPQDEAAITEREAQLRAELAQTEKEIAEWRTVLDTTKGQSASLERDAKILNAKIQEQKLVIKARQLAIETLGKDIVQKEETISQLLTRIERGKESLAQIIRKTNVIDDSSSIMEMLLSSENLSEFFSDVDSFDTINRAMKEHFEDIREAKNLTEQEKTQLAQKKDKETDTKVAVEAEKRKVEANEAEKKRLLSISKTQEKTYAQVIAEREKKAAEIRSALFALRDTAAIPFGTALEYAEQVSKETGIRPAFLLAVITQETNLGKNVGTCNRPGDPPSKHWTEIMPGADAIAKGWSKRNDQAAFLRILSGIGLSPEGRPLSCPYGAGWGGAMGPAQFIPTTWELNAPKIAAALGIKYPNPWEPLHAFMASGIFLSDLGANVQTFTAERNAACRYYSGAACDPFRKVPNDFYGAQVMAKAAMIQETMIDPLKNIDE